MLSTPLLTHPLQRDLGLQTPAGATPALVLARHEHHTAPGSLPGFSGHVLLCGVLRFQLEASNISPHFKDRAKRLYR